MKLISWRLKFQYEEAYAHYQYNHAITVHKSQGSTFENSLVFISEIMRNPNDKERARMLYTAITRASHKNMFI
jgi:ATP-dependent exoDNAse (exonuclease V) alpha subunit